MPEGEPIHIDTTAEPADYDAVRRRMAAAATRINFATAQGISELPTVIEVHQETASTFMSIVEGHEV